MAIECHSVFHTVVRVDYNFMKRKYFEFFTIRVLII